MAHCPPSRGIGRCALLVFALGLWTPRPANADTATFDFDSGTPATFAGEGIPLDQTWGGVTAHFSSPQGSAFSIQNDGSTQFRLSQFSGNYLYPNNLNRNYLDIACSQQLTSLTLTFATADFQQVEVPTSIQLTAYMNSTANPAVGSVTTHGYYAGDTMPMGTLLFNSSAPFNIVELVLPYQAQGATDFLVDNIIVTFSVPQFACWMIH